MYDCVIIGAGIAGTTSAFVLAQMGLHVVVVEAGTHPRFAIGESLVPTTTLGFDYLARTYGVPELRQISHYPELKELGCTGWPKLGFWFGHHREARSLSPGHELMFISPGLPIGPDVHILRSDVDNFLVSRLGVYGIDYLDRTLVTGFTLESDGVKLILDTEGRRNRVSSRFVLDCSGHKSYLAASLGLRQTFPALGTNSRAIFSHFQDVPVLEKVLGNPCPLFRTSRDACTIHHCFEGGWFWVIRFDNGLTSVGLVLDRCAYPDNDLPAQDEFHSFVTRFPTVKAHLDSARAVRPFVKTTRIQFTSHPITGERYLLAPHAAGFIDPLFSTGLDLTVAFVARMAPILYRMMAEDDFCAERLEGLQQCFLAEVKSIDRLIHGMYHAFRHMDIFKQYWRCWVYVSLLQYFTQSGFDPAHEGEPLGHYGASLSGWTHQLERMYQAVVTKTREDPERVAALLKSMMDDFPEPFDREQTNWALGSTEPCCPVFERAGSGDKWFQRLLSTEPELRARANVEQLVEARQRLSVASKNHLRCYRESKAQGTAYHRGVDFIRAQQI